MGFVDSSIVLYIIVPCYNEGLNIDRLHDRLDSTVVANTCTILLINDGSIDKTLTKLRELSSFDPRIKYISFSRNFGHQAALKAGLTHAEGADVVITMDADLQHPPEMIPEMIEKWKRGYKVVNTVRKPDPKASFISFDEYLGCNFFMGDLSLFFIVIGYFKYRKSMLFKQKAAGCLNLFVYWHYGYRNYIQNKPIDAIPTLWGRLLKLLAPGTGI